jgi:hypothetical protein
MIKENITIEDLARMVQKEFSEINQKLGKLDKNDQLILKRLEGVVYRTEFEKLLQQVIHNLLLTNFLVSIK